MPSRKVEIRMTDPEIAALDEAARSLGLSRSGYVRHRIFDPIYEPKIEDRRSKIAAGRDGPGHKTAGTAGATGPQSTARPAAARCPHPKDQLRKLSYATLCGACGQRLR